MGIWSQKREGIEMSITSIKEIPESQSISANPWSLIILDGQDLDEHLRNSSFLH